MTCQHGRDQYAEDDYHADEPGGAKEQRYGRDALGLQEEKPCAEKKEMEFEAAALLIKGRGDEQRRNQQQRTNGKKIIDRYRSAAQVDIGPIIQGFFGLARGFLNPPV